MIGIKIGTKKEKGAETRARSKDSLSQSNSSSPSGQLLVPSQTFSSSTQVSPSEHCWNPGSHIFSEKFIGYK